MNDEEFQILFTTADYRKLENQCKDQQLQINKLKEECKLLGKQIFELENEKKTLKKKVEKLDQTLQSNLSQTSQKNNELMELSAKNQQLHQSIAYAEIELKQKDKKGTEEKEILMSQYQLLKAENSTISSKLSKQNQELQKFKKKTSTSTSCQADINANKQTSEKVLFMEQSLKKSQKVIYELKQKLKNSQMQIQMLMKEKAKAEKQNNSAIKNLEEQLTMKKGKGKANALQQLQHEIETYFSNLVIGLVEIGGIQDDQIGIILNTERKHLEDTIRECSSAESLKIKKY